MNVRDYPDAVMVATWDKVAETTCRETLIVSICCDVSDDGDTQTVSCESPSVSAVKQFGVVGRVREGDVDDRIIKCPRPTEGMFGDDFTVENVMDFIRGVSRL